GVMRVRLVPIRDLFNRMRFLVRGLAHELGREVDLTSTGGDNEVDKLVVERLSDPLLHLVRNAVGHGLETPRQRESKGKPPRGRVDLHAAADGGAITIDVEDDGRGIDAEEVFSKARAAGIISADSPRDPESLLDLLCTPGFSTRDSADRVSGRGVGMDVVRRAIEELGGELAMSSRTGLGTRFSIRLPMTLAIAEAMIVTVGGQTYAVPQVAIREVIQVEPTDLTRLEQNELLRHRGGVLPLIRLADLFGCSRRAGTFPALIVGIPGQSAALGADSIVGFQEVVVQPLADPLVQVRGFTGATELGDGRAILILDVAGLLRQYRGRGRPGSA
ncbi:MAG TPA: chemotaxis protein CheW, partial [Urbifossiella sp.]